MGKGVPSRPRQSHTSTVSVRTWCSPTCTVCHALNNTQHSTRTSLQKQCFHGDGSKRKTQIKRPFCYVSLHCFSSLCSTIDLFLSMQKAHKGGAGANASIERLEVYKNEDNREKYIKYTISAPFFHLLYHTFL